MSPTHGAFDPSSPSFPVLRRFGVTQEPLHQGGESRDPKEQQTLLHITDIAKMLSHALNSQSEAVTFPLDVIMTSAGHLMVSPQRYVIILIAPVFQLKGKDAVVLLSPPRPVMTLHTLCTQHARGQDRRRVCTSQLSVTRHAPLNEDGSLSRHQGARGGAATPSLHSHASPPGGSGSNCSEPIPAGGVPGRILAP